MKTPRFYGLGGTRGWVPPITTDRQRKAHALKHKKHEDWAPYEIEWEVIQESCYRPRTRDESDDDDDDEGYVDDGECAEDCNDWDAELLANGEGEIRSIETSYEDLKDWVGTFEYPRRDWTPSWGGRGDKPEYIGENADRTKVCAHWDYFDWEGYEDENACVDVQGTQSLCVSRAGRRHPDGRWIVDRLTKKEVGWFTELLEGYDPGSDFARAEEDREEQEMEREKEIEERVHARARVRIGWELDGLAGRRPFFPHGQAVCPTRHRSRVKSKTSRHEPQVRYRFPRCEMGSR